jgi:hypothetical protein
MLASPLWKLSTHVTEREVRVSVSYLVAGAGAMSGSRRVSGFVSPRSVASAGLRLLAEGYFHSPSNRCAATRV